MDMVSNFLSLITVWEIGVREAERGRNPKPQKRMKTFLHSISTMRKSNSPSTQPSAHPIWSPTLGRRWKKRHFREVTGVRSVFMTSRIFGNLLPRESKIHQHGFFSDNRVKWLAVGSWKAVHQQLFFSF